MVGALTIMANRFRPGWVLSVAALLGLIVLVALGTWQVQRWHWKSALIAEIGAGLDAAPTALSQGLQAYQPITATGQILNEPVLHQGSYARGGRPGTALTSIFVDASGRQWLLERGWIPETAIEDARAGHFSIESDLTISAVSRPLKRRGPFTPATDLGQGRIYAEDTAELNEAFGLDLQPLALVVTSELAAGPPWDGLPQLTKPDPDLPNNHLGYVITWYGLAAALIGVYIAFGFARAKERS